jgi:hypothetical protein
MDGFVWICFARAESLGGGPNRVVGNPARVML